jgi:hypothetical protein
MEHAILKKSKQPRAILKEGPEERDNFERAMKALFQVPKSSPKKAKKGKD